MRLKLFLLCFILIFTACNKSEIISSDSNTGDQNKVIPEANIAFDIDIDPGSGKIFNALSAIQPIVVNVTSTIPPKGIVVDIVTKRAADSVTVSTNSVSSSIPKNASTIEGLNSGVLCFTVVTVTSKSTSTNLLTKSFKIARK